jgi:hypothetical protein
MRYPLICAALALAATAPILDGQEVGPMAPPPKYEVHRISNIPHPGPPPMPVDQIVPKIAANEDAMKKEYELYSFTETIRIDESGSPGGKFSATGEVYSKPDGQRFMRVPKPPESTLKVSAFSLEDVKTMTSIPQFVLTTSEIGNYKFQYVGEEKLDQLHTYIFRVTPKQLSRTRRLFDGVVWVEDQDFAIVKSYGKFVTEIEENGIKLPFSMFETYRENFQDKYWLPTYTSSDDYITGPQGGDETHLHLVVRSTDFKINAPPAGPASGTPSPSPQAPQVPQSPPASPQPAQP